MLVARPLSPRARSAHRTGAPAARTRSMLRIATAVSVAVALASCSDSASSTQDATASPSEGPAFPVTVETCGVPSTLEAAPERVVTIKSSTTEMLLALGLGDRIVATAYPDGPVADWLADEAAGNAAIDTPLSDKVPGAEAVLETEPDLVYAGWESNLTAEGAGDRATFETLGVATYVSPSACKDPAYQPDPLTFDDVFAEITQVGSMFDVEQEAADLVAEQRTELDAVSPDDRGLTALWYSSGSDIPYVGGGIGAPAMIMDAVGLENVADGIDDTWGPYSWEEAIAADPDVLVLVDSAWNSAEKKIGVLEANPATANLTAVREERYLVVPFPATEAGVRNVAAVVDLAEQLAQLETEQSGTDQ